MGNRILSRKGAKGRVIFRNSGQVCAALTDAVAEAYRQKEHGWVDDLLRLKMSILRDLHGTVNPR